MVLSRLLLFCAAQLWAGSVFSPAPVRIFPASISLPALSYAPTVAGRPTALELPLTSALGSSQPLLPLAPAISVSAVRPSRIIAPELGIAPAAGLAPLTASIAAPTPSGPAATDAPGALSQLRALDALAAGRAGAASNKTTLVRTRSAWVFDGELSGPLDDPSLIPGVAEVRSILGARDIWGPNGAAIPMAQEFSGFALTDPRSLAILADRSAARDGGAGGGGDGLDVILNEFRRQHRLTRASERVLRRALLQPDAKRRTPLERLSEEARRIRTTSVMMTTLAQVRRLYARFFPDFDRAVPVRLEFQPQAEVHGTYTWGPGKMIGYAAPEASFLGDAKAKSPTPFEDDDVVTPLSARLGSLFHEYAHALFHVRTRAPSVPRTEGDSAMEAVNEGFAVTLELLMIDKVLADHEGLGLSEEDLAGLSRFKKGRLLYLRQSRNHYTEGTLRFWHAIYRRGGEAAMLKMLDALDAERLARIPYTHLLFILAGGEPDLADAFTYKDEGYAAWPGLRALNEHLADGTPLSGPALDAARSVSQRMRLSVLDRLFEATLKTHQPNVYERRHREARSIAPLMRLAALDDRVARNLITFALRRLPNFKYSQFASHPEWTDALLRGVAALPMDADERAAWRRLLERWAGEGEAYANKESLQIIRRQLAR